MVNEVPCIFHYAFQVVDIPSTRRFYGEVMGCAEGRSTESWIDFDFFGHQLSAHLGKIEAELDYCGSVDGVSVPIPHFGCVLQSQQFEKLQQNFEANNVTFVVKPQTRYQGKQGQQKTMFVLDFSGNPLEFKSFHRSDEIFSK